MGEASRYTLVHGWIQNGDQRSIGTSSQFGDRAAPRARQGGIEKSGIHGYHLPRLPFLVLLPFSRVSRPSVRQRSEVPEKKTVAARRSRLSLLGPSRSRPPSAGYLSLFLAGQRLMDIHSNEVKAINNSGGNAHPHLVPFLLKSSVCNKRSSHVNALLARERVREGGPGCGYRGVCACARDREKSARDRRRDGRET